LSKHRNRPERKGPTSFCPSSLELSSWALAWQPVSSAPASWLELFSPAQAQTFSPVLAQPSAWPQADAWQPQVALVSPLQAQAP
jgi:hypothetical protein